MAGTNPFLPRYPLSFWTASRGRLVPNMLWSLQSESRSDLQYVSDSKMALNISTSRCTHVFYCCIELLLLHKLFFAYGLLNNFYTSVLLQELNSSQAMFALRTKHKLCHACVDFGCWSSLSPASLKILRTRLTVVSVSYISGTVIQCKASFLYGLNWFFFLLHSYISNFTCHKKGWKAQIAGKRIPLCLLNSRVFICEGSPGSMTATCAAYAACANRPMPNRKFLLWNSMTLIQGSLQTAWSDPKSRRAQGDFTRQPWFAHLALTGWYPL